MPHWLIKSGLQRAISLLPATHFWNELLQEHVWKSMDYHANLFEAGLEYGRKHYEHFTAFCPEKTADFTALEIGTGWYPVVPISLYLCGASDVWCYDVHQFVRPRRLKVLLQFFADYADRGTLRTFLPALREDRLPALRAALAAADGPARETLERLNIHLRVPDARHTGLPADAVDFFYSIGTIQHIPRLVLAAIFTEYCRVSRLRAVMSHFIFLEDQFSKFDRKISPLNYLRYSSRAWKWLNSPLIPQNRLRISDYRDLNRETGFEVKSENNSTIPELELRRVQLAPEFQHYQQEDLLVGWSEMVSQRQ